MECRTFLKTAGQRPGSSGFGWPGEDLEKDHTGGKWMFGPGSNRALEFLKRGGSDFCSTSGIPTLVSRANGLYGEGGHVIWASFDVQTALLTSWSFPQIPIYMAC